MSDTRPAPHKVGMFSTHPAWEPAPLVLPDDPDIGVWVTNAFDRDAGAAMRVYYKVHPDAEFTKGEPRAAKRGDAAALKADKIIGIYANRKRTHG